jgi:hypothetical protein
MEVKRVHEDWNEVEAKKPFMVQLFLTCFKQN